MGHLTTSMSGEQEARTEFVAATVPLRERLEDLDGAVASFDALMSAVVDFGTCELRIRRAERVARASPDSAEAGELTASAMRHHERGLRAMQQARAVVPALVAMEPEPGALATWRQASADVRAEWRDQVKELDVGGSDADHLLRIMDECCDALDDNGPASLAGHLARRLDELESVRREDDRGTRAASFPWWKIVAAAAILGMTAYAVWIAIMSRAPWWAFFLIALVACIMLLFVALGC